MDSGYVITITHILHTVKDVTATCRTRRFTTIYVNRTTMVTSFPGAIGTWRSWRAGTILAVFLCGIFECLVKTTGRRSRRYHQNKKWKHLSLTLCLMCAIKYDDYVIWAALWMVVEVNHFRHGIDWRSSWVMIINCVCCMDEEEWWDVR